MKNNYYVQNTQVLATASTLLNLVLDGTKSNKRIEMDYYDFIGSNTITINVYEGITYTGGTNVKTFNRNRIVGDTNPSGLKILTGATINIAGATLLRTLKGNANILTAVITNMNNAVTLNNKKVYLIQITPTGTNTDVNYNFEWSER